MTTSTSTQLLAANHEWKTRPADERFTSIPALVASTKARANSCKATVVPSRALKAVAGAGDSIAIVGPSGVPAYPSHWAFGQIAQRAGAPGGYLRTLPAAIAADCLNHGLQTEAAEDLGILLRKNGHVSLEAVTGAKYGRVWNCEVAQMLAAEFGDGVSGEWKIPGEFGKAVEITKANTTIFAGDRDMFVFLANESSRIEVPNRRGGKTGSLARGFFLWNSEVGGKSLGLGTFLFDYACSNRIVWGAEAYTEISVRHTSGAPARWFKEIVPALRRFAASSAKKEEQAIRSAQAAKLNEDLVEALLAKTFTKAFGAQVLAAHLREESRPVASVWDVIVGATAAAKSIENQDARVEVERAAGSLLDAYLPA